MKKLFKKITNTIRNTVRNVTRNTVHRAAAFHHRAMAGHAGEGYIDTAVKILIAVVLGALLLAGLYALFGDTVMPTVTQKIRDMFNYAGGI